MISDNYVTGDNVYLRELQNFFFECLGMMSITHYGAVGDGRTDNYGPLQVAIDDANRRGLYYIYVPYGRFIYTGELQNIGDIKFMGSSKAHIVNIRTGEEIEIHQFFRLGDNYYNKTESDDRYVNTTGDTMTGSLAIGANSVASGVTSFAQGEECVASGASSHAEGHYTEATNVGAHAEGGATRASGLRSHAEGGETKATGLRSHAEGSGPEASGEASHAEGKDTLASGAHSHAEGENTVASRNEAHAEGYSTTASGLRSHAEGNTTTASGQDSHAEGYATVASDIGTHAEGIETLASGYGAHAEGQENQATGTYSHAGGRESVASGHTSFAQGLWASATRHSQFAIGEGNIEEQGGTDTREKTSSVFVVGNCTHTENPDTGIWELDVRSNALRLTFEGNLYVAGAVTPGGADYAEMFEWADGNPNREDRTGKFAVIEGNKIRLATSQDHKELMGVISATPTVVGDAFEGYWHGKYVTDVYGRIQYETLTINEIKDEQGNIIQEASTIEQPIISPEFDRSLEYIPRTARAEYGTFAMLGKLIVEDDGTCNQGEYCYPNDNGIATRKYEGFYVLERIDENHIRIFVR